MYVSVPRYVYMRAFARASTYYENTLVLRMTLDISMFLCYAINDSQVKLVAGKECCENLCDTRRIHSDIRFKRQYPAKTITVLATVAATAASSLTTATAANRRTTINYNIFLWL